MKQLTAIDNGNVERNPALPPLNGSFQGSRHVSLVKHNISTEEENRKSVIVTENSFVLVPGDD